MPDVQYLKKLALMGAVQKPLKVSSTEFKAYVGSSSQTVSRKLKLLEDERLIERKLVPGGQLIKMTDKGIEILKNEYSEYRQIFSPEPEVFELEGTVLTGLGEGQYYIGIPGYKKQFEEKLNFEPFPGTLNLQLDENSASRRERLREGSAVQINGFNDGERSYGGGKCYRVKVCGIEAALIVPDRTHYPADLIEIISPIKLREALGLKDGDRVNILIVKQGMETQK
ncbi:MAG: winged helix-turn-helix domain-containing protein/riboflavin kinase [Methanosarcinaceae archaeon]|nr:winged helix-turn-helix domain-containing protein/riboflavin kinase [Methanosarcinaceae archaeon]MDD4496589.1 winged helix-turn-helix domain-containing protein/riboflavin kinase [Methanosarcinaceae archaeon]